MPYGDIRDDWKIQAIERKADEATRRLHEIDSLRSTVDSLERTNRELRTEIDGIRSELEAYKNETARRFEEIMPEMN